MAGNSIYNLTRAELAERLAAWGFAAVHARRLWRYVYREGARDFAAMEELPRLVREKLQGELELKLLSIERVSEADDGLTRKYLLGLSGGSPVETVVMQIRGRTTACISTQAGCPLGCVFCATGQRGFDRNLTTGEIMAQIVFADRVAREQTGERLRNIVVMGMGEPLLNYEAVLRALDIASDSAGLAIAARRITISTVGVVPGILRLAEEERPYSLAVSLHAATQADRLKLLPVARTWPLDVLMEACRQYTARLGRKIFFEWTLIEGENDSAEQAHALAELIEGMPAQVNLIPLNPTAGFGGAPGGWEAVEAFQAVLRERGLPATVRHRRGIEIAAGCGQLAGSAPLGTQSLLEIPPARLASG